MARDVVLGVIPARLGSTRFPGKVLAQVGGRPLVAHALGRLSACRLVERAFVATDSSEVQSAVRALGGEAVLVREECASGSDRVAAAIRGRDASVVVNLQADQPLIAPEDIDRTVEALISQPALDLTTLAFPADDEAGFLDPDVVKVVRGADGRALYFSRAPVPHGVPGAGGRPLYLHHVGIYCFRRGALERFAALPVGELERRESLEQLRAIENGMTVGLVVTGRRTPAVDRPEDVPEVERRLGAE